MKLKNRPSGTPGGGLLVQVGRYTTTALFVGMQLSSGSMTAAGAWKYHPRSCCLLDDLCIMILTVAERAYPRQFFAVCPGLAPRTAICRGLEAVPPGTTSKVPPCL